MKIDEALTILEGLERDMKGYEFGVDTGRLKINNSFALLAIQALQRYLRGEVDDAQADFAILAAELEARRPWRADRSG
jgi:hypothetical protein